MVFDDTIDMMDIILPHRRLLPGRVLRAVRAVPRRAPCARRRRSTGSSRPRPRGGTAGELALLEEIGVGDEGRVHLRPGTDRLQRRRVGDQAPAPVQRSRPDDRARSARAFAPYRSTLKIDGETVQVPEGTTIYEACRQRDKEIPTLCYLETLHPVNVCRVCVVEVEGSRVLVPSCSRKVEPGMVVRTDTERVRHSRKMVLEFLASSVDLSTTPDVERWLERVSRRPERYGPAAPPSPAGLRDSLQPGHHAPPDPAYRRDRRPADQGGQRALRPGLRQVHPLLQVRRSLREGLPEHLRADGRRAGASTPASRLSSRSSCPDSACVYCGNCIAVCPTGALDVQVGARPPCGGHLG
mgnify:CR=1 FL=1